MLTHAAAGTDLLDPALAARLLPASILSMIITPLAIAVGPKLAAGAGRLRVLDRLLAVPTAEEAERLSTMYMANHVIIAGYGIAGQELAICLRECGVDYVIVDLNPENVRKAIDEGEPAYFGDVTSPEVLHHLGAERAKEIVVVINDPGAAERAVAAIRRAAPQAHLVVRARYVVDVEPLLRVGAGKVVPAELEAAVHITSHVLSRRSVEPSRVDHLIARIRTRRKEVASREERLSAVPSINP
ncbi:MAG: NAD-binding protein [Polyangiales bacterium]